MSLEDDVREAARLGITYGKYKVLYPNGPPASKTIAKRPKTIKKPPKRKRKYSDEAAFTKWQQGERDAEIAAELGVSRALIQRWRDTMELPSNAKDDVDTKKYRLIKNEDGIFYATDDAK